MGKLAAWEVKTRRTTSVIEAGCLLRASIIEWITVPKDDSTLSRTNLAER